MAGLLAVEALGVAGEFVADPVAFVLDIAEGSFAGVEPAFEAVPSAT